MKKEALLYKKLDDNAVQCETCSHYCKISKGNVGICGIRQNIDGKLFVLNYGKIIDVAVDPIEKKPFYHVLPGEKVLSIDGLGCNFRCTFCQNWDTSQFPVIGAKAKGRKEACRLVEENGYDFTPKDVIKYAIEKGYKTIAYTYNEPTVSLEFYLEIMKLAKKEKILNLWVTNGYISKEAFDKVKNYIDAANIDLKAFSNKFYRKHCGGDVKHVLENIERFHKAGIWIELTTLLIPDENDSENEIRQIASFIASVSKDIPWHISRFHPDYKMVDKNITEEDSIEKAIKIGKSYGLKYVYGGNIEGLSSTICSMCEKVLIKRDYYETKVVGLNIKNGKARCKFCNHLIQGIFK